MDSKYTNNKCLPIIDVSNVGLFAILSSISLVLGILVIFVCTKDFGWHILSGFFNYYHSYWIIYLFQSNFGVYFWNTTKLSHNVTLIHGMFSFFLVFPLSTIPSWFYWLLDDYGSLHTLQELYRDIILPYQSIFILSPVLLWLFCLPSSKVFHYVVRIAKDNTWAYTSIISLAIIEAAKLVVNRGGTFYLIVSYVMCVIYILGLIVIFYVTFKTFSKAVVHGTDLTSHKYAVLFEGLKIKTSSLVYFPLLLLRRKVTQIVYVIFLYYFIYRREHSYIKEKYEFLFYG